MNICRLLSYIQMIDGVLYLELCTRRATHQSASAKFVTASRFIEFADYEARIFMLISTLNYSPISCAERMCWWAHDNCVCSRPSRMVGPGSFVIGNW
jgi:hypothetical protein